MPSSNSGGAASDDGSSGSGSGGGGALKKGPWTAAEDAILMEYVKKHGEGNWNAVQKNSGLSRCGKSCRLRWANHLRPNLKKGSFSPDEERLILELHSKLGNKWARMAAQLPGRTDNEIKNYWNTRVKRRQRSGLPLYPQDIQRQAAVYHNLQPSNHTHQNQFQLNSSQSPSSPLPISSLHHHHHNQKPNFGSQLSLFDPINFSSNSTPTMLNHHRHNVSPQSLPSHVHGFKRFRGNNVGFSPPNASLPLFNQNFSSQLLPPPPNLQFNSVTFDINPPFLRPHCERDPIVPLPSSAFSMKLELPSSQLPQSASTSASASAAAVAASGGLADDDLMAPSSMARSNSGLLDALLQEAEAMGGGRSEEGRRDDDDGGRGLLASREGKDGLDGFLSKTPPLGSAAAQWDDSSSVHSSMGVKMKKEPGQEIKSVDDDELSSLLNIIPSGMFELYNEGGEISNGQSSVVTDDDIGLDKQQLPSSLSTTTTTATAATTATATTVDHDWTVDAWNNMPDMCY